MFHRILYSSMKTSHCLPFLLLLLLFPFSFFKKTWAPSPIFVLGIPHSRTIDALISTISKLNPSARHQSPPLPIGILKVLTRRETISMDNTRCFATPRRFATMESMLSTARQHTRGVYLTNKPRCAYQTHELPTSLFADHCTLLRIHADRNPNNAARYSSKRRRHRALIERWIHS